ncbi:hypothetical protein SAMN05421824_2460 [Hyunsoonleella jejuensis]|uniref:Lipoprotein n=1 Tax=Hyunsoonleella jejuensis TaxID=419940 RepID=A0A1H9JBH2_9FLAO|nr:hypothetical protein [Hyunsoonleella jejuensis]SEQ84234.1 hypothetical protein SAMN05421824_2460 [Hyunsoonleella jejuensis]
MKKILVPILFILLMGCQGDQTSQDTNPVTALEAMTEYVTINKIFQDVGNNSGDAILESENSASTSKSNAIKGDSPLITVDPLDFTTFPKTITIDYQSGVLCKDGITRKGIVTVVSTDWYGQSGSEHTTTFNNYYHEGYKVEGTHYVKNLGKNENENLEYSVTIENGKITASNGNSIFYSENSTRTWIAGSSTPLNIWDDEYLLDGTQTGVSSKGVTYSLNVLDPLHFVLLPRNIKSGILDVEIASFRDIELNYANRTITVFGKSYPFRN